MNRKTLFIAGGAVAAGALTAGGIALAIALQPSDPGEQYVASSLHELRVVQQGAHRYDVSFALPEDVEVSDAAELAVQLTDTPDYRADAATDATFTLEGDRVRLATAELDAGDHFLWVTAGDDRASVTVTIPDMAPRVWIGDEKPHLEFDQSGDSSWSSYVDPEGKNVYRSASPVFDDTAEPLAEGLAITETSYRVDDPSDDAPYYFLVFTGHGGDSTFVSSPLFAHAEQGELAVELRSIDGAPHYVISGFLGARKADDVERTMRLRVGSYDASNPASTFFVENTTQDAETAESGRFRFEVPARDLAQGYSDLAVFLTEDGATLEWSLDATGVDMAQRVVDGQSVFGLRRAEALQLTRLDLPYERLDVSLAASGTSAVLRVSGTFTEEASTVGYRLVVKDTTGESHTADDRTASARGFSYVVDLAQLDQATVWYDVEFLDPAGEASVPISTLSVADMRQWVATDSRTYAFADYDGLLKVFFDASPFANPHVEFATVDGAPSLVATGRLVGTANSDAFLRIRSGDAVVQDVANTSPTRGAFRFVFDLRSLTKPGTWFDVTFRKASTDTLRDFPVRAADLDQQLTVNSRSYAFHEWNGQLKVAYEVVPGTVRFSNVELVDAAGTPTLRLEGALDRLSASEARLRIRTGSSVLDVPNTATAAGQARFDVDLTALTQAGTWYDVLVGSASSGVFIDVPTSGVDLAQTLALGGRLFELHDWDGQLKVAFTDVSKSVAVSTAELVDVAGVPTLRVTGTVSGTTDADAVLRIRTGSTNIDVPNTSTLAGEALFEYDLSGLGAAGTWYDLLAGVASTSSYVDLTTAVADLNQTLALGGRSYGFREWEGALKVAFDETPVAITPTAAELVDVAGVPTLRVTATYTGTSAGDVFLRIRSGAQTVDVPNSSATSGTAVFAYGVSGLTQAGTWYDLLVGATSSGQLADLRDSIATMTQTVTLGGRSYSFQEWAHDLKVTFTDAPGAFTVTSAELVEASGVPTLRVTGTTTNLGTAEVFLRVKTGASSVDVPNAATAAGEAAFAFDLRQLGSAGSWYDLLAGTVPSGSLVDLTPAVADLDQTLELGGRAYAFHEYDGALKVAYANVAAGVTASVAELVTLEGVPTLRVTGEVHGTSDADAYLRIRVGSTDIDVPNTAATAGEALFSYDVTGLAAGDFELLLGLSSTGALDPIPSALADLDATLGHEGRDYGFGAAGGDLMLAVADVAVAVTVDTAEIVSVSGVPTLRVAGAVTGTGNADAFLRIRTPSVQVIDVPNTATAAGEALFEYDMRGLTSQGAWYDVLVGVTSTAALIDVSTSVADLSDTAYAASKEYAFRAFEGGLKVVFSAATATLAPTTAELLDVSGVATLRVSGTFTKTDDADLFLRVRSGDEIYDVANTATVAGQFRFDFDASAVTKPGTWYDLLVGVHSTGALTNLTPAIANMAQTITVAERAYTFKQYSGLLKLNYADMSVVVTAASAQLLDVSGTPTLRVTGTVTNTTNGDVFLRVRTGSTLVNVPNTASAAGQLSFDFALSGLSKAGTWYDLLLGVTSTGSLSDLPQTVADLGQSLAKDGRTYAFHEWDGLLKVAYDEVLLGTGQSIRIDFGPNDVNDTTRDGNATVSPDANGKYWNNMSFPDPGAAGNSSNVVPNGANVPGLRTTDGVSTTTKVTMNGTNWLSNGINAGGLLNPDPARLGEFAIPTVTQDYFFVQNLAPATLTLSGLDPWHEYDLRFFGTRNATGTRTTTYTVTGSNGAQQAVLQTSGTDIGAAGYDGNDSMIATIENAQPQTDGTLTVSIAGNLPSPNHYGYLAFLEITGDTQLTPPVQVPAEVQRWVNQDAADPLADDSVLFIGSSSIRRWETLTRDFADYDVIQRGWGGSWLSGVNDYSPWVAWPYQPRAIVMWAGTNDLNGGQSAQWVLDEYREFVSNMRANSPDSDFFWISITPNPGNVDKNAVRMQTNALIKAEIEADTTGKLHYIDVATYFENVRDTDPALFASYYVDSLHMTRAGYAKWLETVRPALEAVVPPNKAVTANPATLQAGEKLFFDFGPSNAAEGDPTNVDANGNHWNNWVPTNGGGLVNVGEHIAGLVDSTGRGTGIGMTIAAGFQVNGKTTGGLLAPDAARLGELGVATATEDFFYSSADGKWGGSDDDLPGGLMMTGLDPSQEYEFRLFGSRSATDARVTEYAVIGANSGTAELQTSGTGISHDGTKNGNDSQIAVVSGIRPDAFGQVWIDLTVVQGSYAYLNAMEVLASPPAAPAAESFSAFLAAEEPGVDEAAADESAAEGAAGSPAAAEGEPTSPAPEPGDEPSADPSTAPEDEPLAPSAPPSDPATVPGGSTPSHAERSSGPRDAGGRRAP